MIVSPTQQPECSTGGAADNLLEVRDLRVSFPIKGGLLHRTVGEVQAVSGVSFDVRRGQTLGLVGESGCGKSTVARAIMGLTPSNSGSVHMSGESVLDIPVERRRQFRRDVQLIFQDPFASLNPRMTVRQLIYEAWEVHADLVPKERREAEMLELLERVSLDARHADRYPHQFSGGQRQRISIARALAVKPKLIICDEAVSALDVSIQAQILNLLARLQSELGLAYLFISHDLSVIRHISDQVAVMYLGKIVETATAQQLFTRPSHPYSQALLSASPTTRPWEDGSHRPEIVLEGDLPSPANPPSGCRFRTRCWKAQDICAQVEPVLEDRTGHASACHFADQLENW